MWKPDNHYMQVIQEDPEEKILFHIRKNSWEQFCINNFKIIKYKIITLYWKFMSIIHLERKFANLSEDSYNNLIAFNNLVIDVSKKFNINARFFILEIPRNDKTGIDRFYQLAEKLGLPDLDPKNVTPHRLRRLIMEVDQRFYEHLGPIGNNECSFMIALDNINKSNFKNTELKNIYLYEGFNYVTKFVDIENQKEPQLDDMDTDSIYYGIIQTDSKMSTYLTNDEWEKYKTSSKIDLTRWTRIGKVTPIGKYVPKHFGNWKLLSGILTLFTMIIGCFYGTCSETSFYNCRITGWLDIVIFIFACISICIKICLGKEPDLVPLTLPDDANNNRQNP
jgi:hypothetical protein